MLIMTGNGGRLRLRRLAGAPDVADLRLGDDGGKALPNGLESGMAAHVAILKSMFVVVLRSRAVRGRRGGVRTPPRRTDGREATP